MKSEQRKTHRFQVLPERSQALLLLGKRQIAATLIDQSAGGFCATVDKDVDICKGEDCILQTLDAKYHISIQHVQDIGDKKKLGLAWNECLSDPEPKLGIWAGIASVIIPRRRRDVLTLALTALFVVTLGVIAAVQWSNTSPAADTILWRLLPSRAGRSEAEVLNWKAKSAKQLAKLRIKGKLTPDMEERYGALVSLLSPQVSRDMKLTKTQRAKLQSILDSTTEELVTLYDTYSDATDDWQEASDKVINDAIREAYDALTHPQPGQLPGD